MSFETVSTAQLRQIVPIREQIETLQNQIAAIIGGQPAPATPAVGGKRTMSAAGRARIAAAQRARWAKIKGGKTPSPSAAEKTKPKRKMSAAWRAKIAAAAKTRWAKARAAGKNSL